MGINISDSTYCTLFDSNYIDKGLVMLRSLRKHCNAVIYVLAMDDRCAEILLKENIKDTHIIRLEEFMDDELMACKNNRSHGEFCWSCTASLILYIFDKYSEKICTYIDADLYFYSNPNILVSELLESGKSVQIIKHNFKRGLDSHLQEKLSGTYCVQFNTFINNAYSKEILEEWRKLTLDDSSIDNEECFGDQKYLDNWPVKYKTHINIIQNMGAGVAPWNLERYSLVEGEKTGVCVDKHYEIPIIFYHFHNVTNIDKNHVNIHIYERTLFLDKKLIQKIYLPYLRKINNTKNYLEEKYSFYPLILEHPVLKKNIENPMIKLQRINAVYYILTVLVRAKRKLVRAIAWNRNIVEI